jgi:cytochrome c-type biogenesis protein CcmH
MRPRLAIAVWLGVAVTLLGIGAPGAQAAAPQTSLGEVSSEVMCPVCGTLLELAESPQALREKAFISRLIEEGKSKEQIKDALVAEYGTEVLALPQGSGFDLSAYVVPIVAFAIAVVALLFGVLKWRRAGRRSEEAPRSRPEGPSDEDAERLEADLARYDL